jgi:hypothetical protein
VVHIEEEGDITPPPLLSQVAPAHLVLSHPMPTKIWSSMAQQDIGGGRQEVAACFPRIHEKAGALGPPLPQT